MLFALFARPPGRVAVAAGLAAVLSCADPEAGPAKLSGRSYLPVYRAPRAASPVAVDGRLDEPAWRDAPEAPLLDAISGRDPRYPTTARLLWDAATLYVAVECRDDEPWSRPGRRPDDPIYEDEVVEVFLDPGGRGADYAEIEVSPANVRLDARFRSRRGDLAEALAWSSGAESAVRIEPGRWTVEMAVPLGSLRLPRPGERWRLNVYRLESRNRRGAAEGSALSPPYRPDFHAPERFGWLVFD